MVTKNLLVFCYQVWYLFKINSDEVRTFLVKGKIAVGGN